MCNELKITIRDYDIKDKYYHVTVDKRKYDKDNLNLYFLLKLAYLHQLEQTCVDNLSVRLIRFENNLQRANLKGEIRSNHGQTFIFDEQGGFQSCAKQYLTNEFSLIKWFKNLLTKQGTKK